ncbi:MAG TPA: YraN family protein [Synechococcus sp. M44_DOE_062]|mgnify:CR=1 FL=1|nr:YraN family protein [Synechococcus sp. M44_DOE_062]
MDPSSRGASLQNTGNVGEGWVRQYLCQQGWQILAQQWRCRWGELDLVARKADVLIFVEVKTRSPGSWDRGGLLAVGIPKQQRLIRAAQVFLSQHPHLCELSCRFDVALVECRASEEGVSYALVDYLQAAFEIC